ncbi:glycoside hydrolase family 2 protein [Periconia macrospinosa]|uniref:Beta-mannosidase B n=1 Tax=Periconia macrospinosa TaxID=97972 RepID=A0A2V1E100_9PLEO|nr:glycoside hydrolase family 2 protein [Periconia macrospinosa]
MSTAPLQSQLLSSGWTFKQGNRSSDSEYLPANNVPTEVHLDLFSNGKISDPFKDLNELSSRWIAEESWTYRTSFKLANQNGNPSATTALVLEGLDTFASVYLNGTRILQSDNMFIEHRVDISDAVKQADTTEEFVLEIEFESARQKGLELVEEHSEHRFIVHQTEVSRGPVRKTQYHWGWDWGPLLLGCGPWKPIRLETFSKRIEDLWVEYKFNPDLTQVTGEIFAKVDGSGKITAELSSTRDGQVVLRCTDFQQASGHPAGTLRTTFSLEHPDLWWPRGYGLPSLYKLSATLTSAESPESAVHQVSKVVGFRKVELIQEPDSDGTSFYFRVNNVDIFSGGSCWIPADSFLSRLTDADYHSWIQKAAEGNQAMVRVWGGGIYESDAFYNTADELGVLIWQDFAFACANYPTYKSFLESVEVEARQNVRRLRNHPSLIIWAGNNEDYQIVERYGLEYNYTEDKDPQSWLKTNFPARYIYEYLLPKIVEEETKGVPYHPSSPFGNGTSTVLVPDSTVGDCHQWNLWHGTMEPYQRLPSMGGRFVSEFGMEAYPHLDTLEKCITNEEDRYPGSMAMDFRNKAIGHERRLVSYVAENFRLRYDLPGFTHLTQVMQADALTWAYKSWRRDWGAPGRRKNGGILVWQLNDCWHTMSWAVVDYLKTPKPGYYAIKRELRPVTVNVQRKTRDWTVRPADKLWHRDTSHIDMRNIWGEVEFDCWVASSKTRILKGEVAVRYISVKSGKEVLEGSVHEIEIAANGTTDVIKGKKVATLDGKDPKTPFQPSSADPFVIHVTLTIDGEHVGSDISWPDPIKYLSFPERGVKVSYLEDGKKAHVTAQKPVKGFVFSEKEGMILSDNGFDVVPGETKEVSLAGDGDLTDLKWRYVEISLADRH